MSEEADENNRSGGDGRGLGSDCPISRFCSSLKSRVTLGWSALSLSSLISQMSLITVATSPGCVRAKKTHARPGARRPPHGRLDRCHLWLLPSAVPARGTQRGTRRKARPSLSQDGVKEGSWE